MTDALAPLTGSSPGLAASLPPFGALVIAMVVEAAPFLLLGSLVSALLEALAPGDLLSRRLPKGRAGGILAGLLAGLVLPTCECGVVPIVRRLILRGAPAHTALAYMLAAPVINPVVLLSTWMAFRGDWSMVAARAGVVAVTAGVVAAGLAGLSAAELLRRPGEKPCGEDSRVPAAPLLPRFAPEMTTAEPHGPGCGCGCGDDRPGLSLPLSVARTTALEFLDMGRFLILGAVAAALIKTWLPAGALFALEDSPALSIAAMMALAVALCVCSETDAFVAASFATFSPAAQLAFMAHGPMLDLKLMAMLLVTFRRRPAMALMLAPAALIYCLCLALALGGWAGRW